MVDGTEDEEAVLREMIEAAQGGRGRSPLYRFFWRHFERLAPEFSRPDWEAVARTANEKGLLAGGGKPVTAGTARQTFWKVDRDRKKAAERAAGAPVATEARGAARRRPRPKALSVEPAPAVFPAAPAADPGRMDGGGERRPRFGPARLRTAPPGKDGDDG